MPPKLWSMSTFSIQFVSSSMSNQKKWNTKSVIGIFWLCDACWTAKKHTFYIRRPCSRLKIDVQPSRSSTIIMLHICLQNKCVHQAHSLLCQAACKMKRAPRSCRQEYSRLTYTQFFSSSTCVIQTPKKPIVQRITYCRLLRPEPEDLITQVS